jgi:hypothetical protein
MFSYREDQMGKLRLGKVILRFLPQVTGLISDSLSPRAAGPCHPLLSSTSEGDRGPVLTITLAS